MKFLKQNFFILIVLILLIISIFKLNDLQARFNDLSSQYYMLRSSMQSIANNQNNNIQQSSEENFKEVMAPTDLAKYLDIELNKVYELATRDNNMPYVMINGEYRFSKAAIDKWMETRITIETRQ